MQQCIMVGFILKCQAFLTIYQPHICCMSLWAIGYIKVAQRGKPIQKKTPKNPLILEKVNKKRLRLPKASILTN